MPRDTGLPPGTLMMLVLRVLSRQPLHGYAIAQHIHHLSNEQLSVEEGSLYPALQKLLDQGLGEGRVARVGVGATGARIPHHGQRTKAARRRDRGVPADDERDRLAAGRGMRI